ncbi:MAG: vanadium-dependent haloperoxidase [Chloroflexi bacterium]|nr:MAG: vanadium-dependent haloperoxidase [Chloroflexota bacterium]
MSPPFVATNTRPDPLRDRPGRSGLRARFANRETLAGPRLRRDERRPLGDASACKFIFWSFQCRAVAAILPKALKSEAVGEDTMRSTTSKLHRMLLVSLLVTAAVGGPTATRSVAADLDVVLEWNALAISTMSSQPPFAQARFAAIAQLAVFEAVNAVTSDYQPYLGTIDAPDGASADAAAVAAAHAVLKNYFPASATSLDAARASSLAAIPDGTAKDDGIATGVAAAAAMIAARVGDGSAPPTNKPPGPAAPGVWQMTPSCPAAGGIFFNWQNVTPFGIDSVASFMPGPPPSLTSNTYTKDYLEVKTVGSLSSTARPQDRADVVRFYAVSSPTRVLNDAARQVSVAQGRSLSENARALALLNMAISDSLVTSFATKYHYNWWRPETAIRAGDTDDNPKTNPDASFVPFITTPCFPSYPSNHASGTGSGAEILRRLYGAGGHSITLSNPAVAGITLHYTTFKQITDDVDDARVYGGIHFRFEQEVGGRLGRDIATYIVKHDLRGPDDPD